jgi:transketolase
MTLENHAHTRDEIELLIAENTISILRKCYEVNAGHIGGSLSLSSFLLPLLYFLKLNDELVDAELVLSKGHASLGMYAILNTLNINSAPFQNYCNLSSDSFHGHTCKHADKLIVHSTGSLGHGLPFSYGRALGNKLMANSPKKFVLCILGDGELQEGTFYESYLHYSCRSDLELKIIIDDNSSIETSTKCCSEIIKRLSIDALSILNCRDFQQCCNLVNIIKRPGLQLVQCKTSKYVGLPDAFHDPKWHAGLPTDAELESMITGLRPAFN